MQSPSVRCAGGGRQCIVAAVHVRAPHPSAKQRRTVVSCRVAAQPASAGIGQGPIQRWFGRGRQHLRLGAAAAEVAVARTSAADASAAGTTTPAPEATPSPATPPTTPYNWTANWWPVAPISALDPAKPYPVTLLGHSYVVWYNKQQDSWQVMEDRCPHRLAPLSEGRVEANGNLACSYHGWEFDTQGNCKRIPQVGDGAAAATSCSNRRACVATYPVKVVNGLLFVWLESGPAAAAAAATQEPHMPAESDATMDWGWNEIPVDYTYWASQAMDPTHANYLHANLGFSSGRALPMEAEALPPSRIDLQHGFTWHHGAYDTKTQGMKGERQFISPNCIRVAYDKGVVAGAAILSTPVRPGVSRVFAKFSLRVGPAAPADPAQDPKQQQQKKGGGPAALIMSLVGKLPHWLVNSTMLGDQDLVMNAAQERYMRSVGGTRRDQYQPARADAGVVAAHQWMEMAGYDQMWEQRLGIQAPSSSQQGRAATSANTAATPASNGSTDTTQASNNGTSSSSSRDAAPRGPWAWRGYQAPSEQEVFDVWERHTQHCAVCCKGLKTLQSIAQALGAAAALLAVAAAGMAVAAHSLANPGALAAAAAAAVCAWLRWKVLCFRYDRLISSKYLWDKAGGLSLVPGKPIRLPQRPTSSSYPL